MAIKSYPFRNIEIHYYAEGDGPAVVLLHGFGEDKSVWSSQVDYLKQNFRVLVPDIPGSGATPMLAVGEASQQPVIDQYADAVKALLDFEQMARCVMIGHSMGGYVTLAAADMYPERLDAFGLFHSTAFADSPERVAMRCKGIEFIRKNGAEAFLRQAIPNLFTAGYAQRCPGKIEDLINKSGNFAGDVLVQYYEAMMERPDRSHVFKKYQKPVLFIAGEEDKSVYLQDSLKQFHLPAISDIKILKQTAHMGMWEMEEVSNKTLEKFLNYVVDG